MYLTGIELNNWMAFRGKQTIQLEPKAYAIVARHADDPERSNWAGKSALVEAVDFVLHGRLNKDRGLGADGWVTDGEKEGGVKLTFDDGTVAERARKKTTALTLSRPSGYTLKKEEAQAALTAWIGLSAEDFPFTCYFRQRQLAQLILARPEVRMETVSAWFRLGPLEAAEDDVSNQAAALAFKAQQLQQRLENAQLIEQRELTGNENVEKLQDYVKELEKALDDAKAKHGRLQERVSAETRTEALSGAKERYEALVADGRALRAKLEEQDGEKLQKAHKAAQAKHHEVHGKYMAATRQVDAASLVATGKFDGECPVACIPCPIAKDINARTVENGKLLEAAEARAAKLHTDHNIASSVANDADAKLQAHGRMQERLDILRQQAVALQEDAERYYQDSASPEDFAKLQQEECRVGNHVLDLTGKLATIRRSLTVVVEVVAEQARIAEQLHAVNKALATHREAKVVLGKNGAQRRVAEGALGQIEVAANEMLRTCGIDLGVEVRWSREGSGLAKACDACGHPFPASARAKECERCQTARGPNLVNKLDILLTDQSGAAEDLAGAALQLAAARWLRSDRGSDWGVAMIDEAFGALDPANRRAFASHLAGMLHAGYGFDQSFVIAHHASVLDALPGRILVTAHGPGNSTLRVVA